MEFAKLIEYNMRFFFFFENVVEKLSLDPFLKNEN